MIKLFKGKLDAGKVFDTISSGVDKLAFTQQEKSELNMLLADKVAVFAKDTLSESTVRSKTRRFISISIISTYLLMLLLLVVLSLLKVEVSTIKELIFDSPLSSGFIMVLVFFFGGYYLKGFSLKKEEKKENKK
ncbi:MAG: hypothetical protein IMY72_11715 [Bacteroidetes bacterium]|nr:hypothetical protein [Bacteroidota bacterium]